MPPPAIANPLRLILLLIGSAVWAADALPADGGAAAGQVEEAARPWNVRQASPQTPNDVFRPFEPPQHSDGQQSSLGGVRSRRDGAAIADRDGSPVQQPKPEPVVPAAYQVPAPAGVPASGNASPAEATPRAAPEVASSPVAKDQTVKETPAAASHPASGQNVSVPLAPRRGARPESASAPQRVSGLSSLMTVGSSLAVVLGLFFILAWLMRRTGPRAAALLPTEVVEVLGRAPLAARQQIHLLRFGGKLVLICLGPDGAHTLTEITEPDEVTRLAGLCHQAHSNSTTAAFRQVFQQFHSEANNVASVGSSSQEDLQLANAGFRPIQGGRLEDRDV